MNKVRLFFSRNIAKSILALATATLPYHAFAEECNEETMDAFAYEDCVKAQQGIAVNNEDFSNTAALQAEKEEKEAEAKKVVPKYNPFDRDAYLTSSFGENRGTRYHAGLDYSTQMEEGWPIFAPEDGFVKELKVSPFGYGKVMFFQGRSGKTWVFAHQSSFGALDAAIAKQQYATKKNDVSIKPGTSYKKGDTLTYSGSTGIGNPHLHVEVRLDKDRVMNPALANIDFKDSIAPQVFGAAVWQDNELAFTAPEAIDKGCIVTPVKNEFKLNLAVKIADYSREPKENPMSVRRISLWRYDEKVFDERLDTLRFSRMLDIRNQLLWTEEADTAGDWHFIRTGLAPLSTYTMEIEDFAGNITKKKFSFRSKCKDNRDLQLTKNQTTPLFTALSRPMIDFFNCKNGMQFSALGKDGVIAEDLCKVFEHKPVALAKILETYPSMTTIHYSASASQSGDGKAMDEDIQVFGYGKYQTSVNWNTKLGNINISQKISGMPAAGDTAIRVLAVTRNHTDSLDFIEFHPKGLQLKNWDVCIENPENPAPLYWLGETSRNWFIFSKQNKGKKRCASTNELRDIANIDNPDAPTLGFPYWSDIIVGGVRQPALKIPLMFKYDGIADGNAITVKAGKNWIAAEYDSEPREIVLEGEKLPDSGEDISIQIVDEAGHKISYDITIPEM